MKPIVWILVFCMILAFGCQVADAQNSIGKYRTHAYYDSLFASYKVKHAEKHSIRGQDICYDKITTEYPFQYVPQYQYIILYRPYYYYYYIHSYRPAYHYTPVRYPSVHVPSPYTRRHTRTR
jgi:hypothetical protein